MPVETYVCVCGHSRDEHWARQSFCDICPEDGCTEYVFAEKRVAPTNEEQLTAELARLRTQLEDAEEVIDYYRSQPGHGWADNYRKKYPLKDAAKDAGRGEG